MRSVPLLLLLPVLALAEPPEPKFRPFTLDDKIQIGYGVAVADVDGDQRPDVLLADKRQIVWYKNPGQAPAGAATLIAPIWNKFVIAENLTEKDNVCLAAQDIDGDGKCEIAVGAEWNPGDTEKSGAVFYLIAPEDRQQRWTPVKFPSVEPTTHRMRWVNLYDGSRGALYDQWKREGKDVAAIAAKAGTEVPEKRIWWGLAVVPLHGRGNKNGEGAPVKVLLYHPPTPLNDPQGEWKSEVIDESMHMTHNFDFHGTRDRQPRHGIILGGREGIVLLGWFGNRERFWFTRNEAGKDLRSTESVPKAGAFDADFRGAGEVRHGWRPFKHPVMFIAAVEPMHGNQLAVYFGPNKETGLSEKQVLTDKLTEGHALACGDLLGVKSDQIVVGWRGTPGKAGSTTGVAMWTPMDEKGEQWRETMIDRDGMACEDLVLADLDADGDLDIVASGRATRNVKIYWNETPR